MRDKPAARVDEELWASALLSADTEALIGAARNYLGPVKTPYDKRELVARLAAFLRRPDAREGILALLDDFDARLVGTALLLGPLPESELRGLFAGELPLFDLGIRVSNLLDRLLVFRFDSGGRRLLAVNPILAGDLGKIVLDARLLFGVSKAEGQGAAAVPSACTGVVDAEMAAAFFIFLRHTSGALRKGGGLTKRASERAAVLFPDFVKASASGEDDVRGGSEGPFDALALSFAAAGVLGDAEGDREADPEAFDALAEEWGAALPALLAAALARAGADQAAFDASRDSLEEPARLVRASLAMAPPELGFSQGGFSRWIGIASRLSALRPRARMAGQAIGFGGTGHQPDSSPVFGVGAERLLSALAALGLARETENGIFLSAPWRESEIGSRSAKDESVGPAALPSGPVLVAEGSHALHLLPEALVADRLFVGRFARPTSFGKVWSMDIDRESARRGFAGGMDAKSVLARIGAMAKHPLPQSLSFSLESWEKEYRSLRLYRGFVLVADERQRQLVECSERLARYIAERLAPGIYLLAAPSLEEAQSVLREAGLEPPPEMRKATSHGSGSRHEMRPAAGAAPLDEAPGKAIDARIAAAVEPLATLAERAKDGLRPESARQILNPAARIASLKAALASLAIGSEDRPGAAGRSLEVLRELGDRIERRIILSERQLAAADARPERGEASGLDYQGKVRIVEHALHSVGDRLEVSYRLPGADPVRALLRPVRLDKTDKGLVLEAEDLATGGPTRVPLGAMSSVKRMRASLFGEET